MGLRKLGRADEKKHFWVTTSGTSHEKTLQLASESLILGLELAVM